MFVELSAGPPVVSGGEENADNKGIPGRRVGSVGGGAYSSHAKPRDDARQVESEGIRTEEEKKGGIKEGIIGKDTG